MALSLRWYDALCFAIVAAAALGAGWLIAAKARRRRRRRREEVNGPAGYVSLAAAGPPEWQRRSGGSAGAWVGCWRGLHPGWLFGVRAVSAAVMVVLLAFDIAEYGFLIFVYYTEWTFSLVILYFALGAVISAHACWTSSTRASSTSEERTGCLEKFMDLERDRSEASAQVTDTTSRTIESLGFQDFEEIEQQAGFWGCAMQVVYQTSAGAVMLTDIVFWCLIVPFLTDERFALNLLMGSMHSLNLVFLLLDTALNSMPFPWFGMAYFVLWSCLYVVFQWILHACGFTWWPYPFLELATPWAPLWYFCMALVHVPCYVFYYLVVKAKDSLFSKWFPNSYIRSSELAGANLKTIFSRTK